jgi:hypothetical protein
MCHNEFSLSAVHLNLMHNISILQLLQLTHLCCLSTFIDFVMINEQDTFSAEMIESTVAHAAASNTTASRSGYSSSNGSSSDNSKAHNGKSSLTTLSLPHSQDNSAADTDLSVSARFLLVSGQC